MKQVIFTLLILVANLSAARKRAPVNSCRDGLSANAAVIGLINLIYDLARYEQIVLLKLRTRTAA